MTHTFIFVVLSMVVKTRLQYSRQQREREREREEESTSAATSSSTRGGRRVRITTPSFREASIRTYKEYTPSSVGRKAHKKHADYVFADASSYVEELSHNADYDYDYDHDHDDADADALLSLQDAATASRRNDFVKHACMNPMSSVTKYIYRISVYNIHRSAHMKTAYVLYDPQSLLYYVYTIVSHRTNDEGGDNVPPSSAASSAELPEPMNTLQLKYTTFVSETVVNYVMTLIVPSNHYDYYIQDDIIGIVWNDNTNFENVFDEESSFYDIEGLLYDKTSTLTTNGYKAFMLLPSRQFWYYGYSSSCEETDNQIYTCNTIHSVLVILSQSH